LPGALAALGALEPPRLIYVSCKPESLARDLRALEAIGYRPEGPAQPVDLFPQSHHVETVVSLTRVGSA
jgi:23S rRNA (uracil1939-C5)-methyltransferase